MNGTESQPDRIKQPVGSRRDSSLIKPMLPEVVCDLPNEDRTEQLVDLIITTIWAKAALGEYNGLPKGTSRERKIAADKVRKTTMQLLKNPHDIIIAQKIWGGNELRRNGVEKPQEPFSELVKKECLTLIKDKWEDVKPEQLAQLVGMYANNPEFTDFAKELLVSYFRGPQSRRQRIDAYYNFASCILDLVGHDKALNVGIKIGLHDTEILQKDKDLIEQTLLLSLPYNEEERVFQKLLIAKNVVFQLSFLSSEDLGEVRQKHYDFLSTNDKLKKRWSEELGKAVKQIGKARVSEINEATMAFDMRREDVLSEEEKLELENIWPFNLFFDKSDPLNQKFQKVLSERGALPI